MTAGLLQEQ